MAGVKAALGMAWTAVWFTAAGLAFTLIVYAVPVAIKIVSLFVAAGWRALTG